MVESNGRLFGIADPGPCLDLDDTVQELHWLAEHGFVGVAPPGNVADPSLPPLTSRHWDPFWAACEQLGLVLTVHAAFGDIVGAVAGSAAGIERTAQGLSQTAGQAEDRAAHVARVALEASANVQAVATATGQLTAAISEIGTRVTRSARVTDTAAAQAEPLVARHRSRSHTHLGHPDPIGSYASDQHHGLGIRGQGQRFLRPFVD